MLALDPQRLANDSNNEGPSERCSVVKGDINPNSDGTFTDMDPVNPGTHLGEKEQKEAEEEQGIFVCNIQSPAYILIVISNYTE